MFKFLKKLFGKPESAEPVKQEPPQQIGTNPEQRLYTADEVAIWVATAKKEAVKCYLATLRPAEFDFIGAKAFALEWDPNGGKVIVSYFGSNGETREFHLYISVEEYERLLERFRKQVLGQ